MKTLLLGCGSRRQKLIPTKTKAVDSDDVNVSIEWRDIEGEIVTVDINVDHKPDLVLDLNQRPLPFEDNEFDEILAFEVLEHLGTQGDYEEYFHEFSEYWRILKPGGKLIGTVPKWDSMWAWGDPSHTRVLPLEGFVFLSQEEYAKQIGTTSMSDMRHIWKGDFALEDGIYFSDNGYFCLRAIK